MNESSNIGFPSADGATFFRVRRSSGYYTVHRNGCRILARAKHRFPWVWAEGREERELFGKPWNVPCVRVCFPHREVPSDA